MLRQENGEYEKIYNQSIVADGLINKYNKARKILEKERKSLMNKYEKELDQPFKHEIIGMIRTEVRKKFPSVGIDELLHFSTNVYVYCILKIYNVPEQEIVDQLKFLNNIYIENSKEDNSTIKPGVIASDLEYLQNIANKYEKIIKERI